MAAESVICTVICIFVALIMLTIGVLQLKSKEPVGFYSGEQPPKKEDVTDVIAWNKKHGILWIVYGILIALATLTAMLMGDTIWCLVPLCGGFLAPIVWMIRCHNKLKKKYLR